jgi:3-hydroxyisobutyrate dehydrogenase-like beta-hydroxyacid dehydrogenase
MAQMVARGDFDLAVWARREASYEALAADRHERSATPASLGGACDVVCVCVTADDDVREVVLDGDLLASMQPGSVLVIHATVSPALLDEVAPVVPEGVAVLDAPVSGGGFRAYDRSITVMAGGDQAAFARVLPVFQCYAGVVGLAGPAGSGLVCKLLNNGLYNAHLTLAMQAEVMAAAFELDVDAFRTLISNSTGQSGGGNLFREHPDEPGIFMHTIKDVGILEQELLRRAVEDNELRHAWRAAAAVAAGRVR